MKALSRTEKINLLHSIATGRKTISDVLPQSKEIELWYLNSGNLTYTNKATGKIMAGKPEDKGNVLNILVHKTGVPQINSEKDIL